MDETTDLFAECNVISVYTRKQAIADGVLVDLSKSYPSDTRMFKWNLACTSTVWSLIENAAEKDGCEIGVYVWDVCWMAFQAIQAVRDSDVDTIFFNVMLPLRKEAVAKHLKLVCGPDDDATPCLTVMLPEED